MPTPKWLDLYETTPDGRSEIFYPRIATIKRVFDNQYGVSWTFREDTDKRTNKDGKTFDGQIWKAPQGYDGPKFKAGDKVKVRLKISHGEKGGTYHDVDRIAPDDTAEPRGHQTTRQSEDRTGMSGSDTIPAEFTLPLDYYREKNATERASFERQAVLNRMSEVLIATPSLIEAKVITQAAAKRLFEDWQERASYMWNRHGEWSAAGDDEPETFRPDEQPAGKAGDGDGSDDSRGGEGVSDPGDLPWDPEEVE